MPRFEILRTQEYSDLTPANTVVKRMRVTWRIDDQHGPYVDTFPSQPFDEQAAKLAIDARAGKILSLAGRS